LSDQELGSTGADTGGAPAGDGFLSSGFSGGNPEPAAQQAPEEGTADRALQDVQDGPPEGIPLKYWDAENREVRVDEMAQGYNNLEKLLGTEKVPVPQSDDDEEGWDRFYKAAGRPDDPGEYGFEPPEQMPESLPYDTDLEQSYRNVAHKNGLSDRQAKAIYDAYVKTQIERTAEWEKLRQENRAEMQAKLQREYGQRYEGAVNRARTAMNTFADPDFVQFLQESNLDDDPRMIRFMERVGGRLTGERKLVGKQEGAATPQDVDRAISDFRAKNAKALHDRNHPDNARLTAELQRLYASKYPEA
jgi:hypothetical protein